MFCSAPSASSDPFGGGDSNFADFANFDSAGVRFLYKIDMNLCMTFTKTRNIFFA